MSGSVVWRCVCQASNYRHWGECFACGAPQPPPPEPVKRKQSLKEIADSVKGNA